MRSSTLILSALFFTACGKSEPAKQTETTRPELAPTRAEKVTNMNAADQPPPAAPARDLKTLKTTLPAGWSSEFSDTGQWVFKTAAPDGRPVYARINLPPADAPAATATYIEYEKARVWNKGIQVAIESEEARPGGFAASLRVGKPDDPKPNLEYRAIWELDGVKLRCEATWAPTAEIRDQVAAICKSASW